VILNKNKINKKAMSIIEVMIAIFIFTLGISSVFMIISSTSGINSYNKNFIIASNLAREQIELIRNTRDTNYKKFQKWNILNP
jgi:Tfp pilus assembly protein PilV